MQSDQIGLGDKFMLLPVDMDRNEIWERLVDLSDAPQQKVRLFYYIHLINLISASWTEWVSKS